ncbi:EAL domain-containing protein [Marinobacterium sp. D7]|uniref:bifunctional diguanylate cyclase/phosphodiesterase n=1 Tax=Marinobacterium ramblicola TaxID=2849041 RepID=UPI001C2D9441|nr:EAL domain-containing protein [Marinobacterium ramblicola]MBV1788753.1 EAL domain-containing protein [Marinobacterium ramblicola]
MALTYLLAAFLITGQGMHQQIMPFWAPAGIALGAVLRFGPAVLPGVLLGSLGFNLWIPLTWHDALTLSNVLTALAIGSGAMIQASVAAALIHRFNAYPLTPENGRSLAVYALIAGPLSCLINSTLGTSVVYFVNDAGGSAGFLKDWLLWWGGDSFGAIVLAPVVLALLPERKTDKKRRRSLVARLVGIVGLVLLLNHLLMLRLDSQLRRDFQRDTRLVEAHLFSAIQKNFADLAYLGQRFSEPGGMTPDQFRARVAQLTADNPSVRAYSWDPVVQVEQRQAFERATAQMLGEPDYAIYGESLMADDPLIPVQMVEPRELNRRALGFNLLSIDDRRRSVMLAQNSGQPVVTEVLNLTQAPDQPGFLILHPVYRMIGEYGPLQRQRELAGFMVGVFTVSQLLGGALEGADIHDIRLRLKEQGADLPFFSNFPESGFDGLFGRFELQVGQRVWQAEAAPGPDYMAGNPSGNATDMQLLLVLSAAIGTLLVLSMHDRERILMDEVDRQTRSLAYQARHDDLTGLPNRSHLIETIRKRVEDPQSLPFSVLFIDLDRFKLINDSLGHQAGDRMLQKLAQLLTARLPKNSLLFRMGGDEFILLVEGDVQQASIEADRVLIATTLPLELDDVRVQITASIGISHYPDHGVDLGTLIKHADTAMYRAKAQGKNRYVVYSEEFSDQAFHSFSLEQDLRVALDERQLVLHYQPQFDLKTMQLVGTEALVRWNHPTRGLLAPGHFIEMAEETQLIIPLGWQVIELVCDQMKHWEQRGIKPPQVAINISPQQLLQIDFVEKLNKLVDGRGVLRTSIELEITELMIMQDPDLAMMQLHRLRESGYRIALDDFGTGYSSLDRLKYLPLDRLKIDQAFTRDIGKNPKDEAVILTIIALGRSLGIEVLAEGVETESQLRFLGEHACNSVQGYLLGRPIPAEELCIDV